MGLWRRQVLPRVINATLGTSAISAWRMRCLAGAQGTVVEPGFGSGLNLPHLPPEVTKVYAIDPAVVGQQLASKRLNDSAVEVEFIGLRGEQIPLDNNTCDSAILTFTLCTIPLHQRALSELRRVLKPGGTLHFLEHGKAPDVAVQRWQDIFNPVQNRIADGCHLNRAITDLISLAGFEISWTDSAYAGRPKFGSYFSVGVAVN